jgi:hypothetical protein
MNNIKPGDRIGYWVALFKEGTTDEVSVQKMNSQAA